VARAHRDALLESAFFFDVLSCMGLRRELEGSSAQMPRKSGNLYPWHLLQVEFPLSEQGVAEAIEEAMAMQCVKATIVPF
jgi:hypothetical protein